MIKKILNSFYVKLLVSLVLIFLIFSRINLQGLKDNLLLINVFLFGLATLLFFVQQIIIVYAWLILLKAQGNSVPFLNLLEVYVIGSFWGTFLPSSIGMDVVRIYGLSKYLNNGVDPASSMFVARLAGFVILIGFALAAAIPLGNLLENTHLFIWIVILFIIFMASIILVLSPFIQRLFYYIFEKLHLYSVKTYVEKLYVSIYQFSKYKMPMIRMFAVTIVFQILGIYIIFLVGKSLNINVVLTYYFLLIPIIMVITLIPISIAGIGVREGSFVYFFSLIGLTATKSLSLSLMIFFQWLLLALIGAAVYLIVGFNRTKKGIETSEL